MTRIPALGLQAADLVHAMGERGVPVSEAAPVGSSRRSSATAVPTSMKRPVHASTRRWKTIWMSPNRAGAGRGPDRHSLRYLFELSDGSVVEAVRIPLHVDGRFSVCLSSQVGCAMRCDFCATGRLGLDRHLSAHEIIGCFLQVRDEAPGRVTGAVFMGQGEPLHNYDAVLQAARVLADPCGGRISAKAISISTVGIVPRIHQFAEEGHKFRLVISLTSADPERRRALMPVAGRWSLEELAGVRALHRAQRRRITVAWVLMAG